MDQKPEKGSNESLEIVLTVALVCIVGIIFAAAGIMYFKIPVGETKAPSGSTPAVPTQTVSTPASVTVAETSVIPTGTPQQQATTAMATPAPSPEMTPGSTVSPTAVAIVVLVPGSKEVQFSVLPVSGEYPLPVQFTDLSTNFPTAWFWDFGDGSTSYQQNVVHTYTSPGTYNVTLTTTTTKGKLTSEPKTVTVSSPVAGLSSVYPVVQCVMNNADGSYTAYFGYRNDYNTSVSIPVGRNNFFSFGAADHGQPTTFEPGLHYNAASIVFTAHEVDWTLGTSTAQAFMGSQACAVAPTAKFEGYPVYGFALLQVTFNDQSPGTPTSWYWTFGDGSTSTEQNPQYLYKHAGNYTVSLTVKNKYGENSLTKTEYIHVS